MDREQARERAQALLERWVSAPDAHDELLTGLSATDLQPIEMVGALEHPEAGDFLAAVAAGPVSKDMRKGARRGLHRLRASGKTAPSVQIVVDHPTLRLNVEYRFGQARVSAPDGIGSRWLWLFVDRSTGGGFFFGLILNETVGVKDVMVSDTTRRRYTEHVDETTRNSGIQFHKLPPEYARALIAEALQLNQATDFTVPTELQTYRPVLGELGDPPERALIYESISAAETRLDATLLEASVELMSEPEVDSWIFDFHQIRPFAEQMRQSESSLVVVHESAQQERVQRIETEALRTIITDEVRLGLKRRLEETAYIFWITDRERAAKLAVAAALALDQPIVASSVIIRVDRGPSRGQHPLILEMLRRSIAVANELEMSGMGDSVPRRTAYDPVVD